MLNVPASPDFIVDPVIPRGEVHLIGGPSGSGKTTMLIPILQDILEGRPVFGYPSTATEWTFVSCDRSLAGIHRTLDRIGYPAERHRFRSIDHLPFADIDVFQILRWCPSPLLVLDGFASLLPTGLQGTAGNSYQPVARWLRKIGKLAAGLDKTIIGTLHTTKLKTGESFADPRQELLGSSAWGAYAETIIIVKRGINDEYAETRRTVRILPRNAPERVLYYDLDDRGRLRLQQPGKAGGATVNRTVNREDLLGAMFRGLLPGMEFRTAEFARWVAGQVDRATTFRWLRKAVERRMIERVGWGLYRKLPLEPLDASERTAPTSQGPGTMAGLPADGLKAVNHNNTEGRAT